MSHTHNNNFYKNTHTHVHAHTSKPLPFIVITVLKSAAHCKTVMQNLRSYGKVGLGKPKRNET